MFRKFFAATIAAMLVVGGLFAEEITGIFMKFDDKDNKVTVKVDDKEKTYKVDPDAKIKRKIKGKETEFEVTKLLASKFMEEGKTKLTLTVEDDVVKKVELAVGGKKKKP